MVKTVRLTIGDYNSICDFILKGHLKQGLTPQEKYIFKQKCSRFKFIGSELHIQEDGTWKKVYGEFNMDAARLLIRYIINKYLFR